MSAFWGMDPEQMRSHAQRLRTASGEVETLSARLGTTVEATTWTGSDADAFRERWAVLASSRLTALCEELLALSEASAQEADQQDAVSTQSDPVGPTGGSSSPAEPSPTSRGYRHENDPLIPGRLGSPAESLLSGVAQRVSDGIGWGVDAGIDLLEGGLGLFGVNTDGIAQLHRDADHFGGILEDWATGDRVPTVAEVGAAGLLTLGSAGVGIQEAITGEDTAFLDDRPGGIVESVRMEATSAPQDLQDLITRNDALRLPDGGAQDSGQIGIQEIRRADGGAPGYIVQIPPTEGASITDVPEAWGGQGSSRDWASNLRLVAGQQPAAMDDVRAAMQAAGIPAGSDVMIVGHSQGGIVANHLAADPAFNSPTGEAGSYNITHTFTVGSPVQTVVPAQGSTQSVNVHHQMDASAQGFSGDLITGSDLGGLQLDGGILGAPNRHEVSLPGYPVPSPNPVEILEHNHDSTGRDGELDLGYSGSVDRATGTDPTLSALQRELSGTYLGEGTHVAESQVVTVGRGEP